MRLSKPRGIVSVFFGDKEVCRGENMIVRQANEVLCRLMSPDRDVSMSHVFFEFSADPVAETTPDTTISMFESLPPGVDYVEIPLLQAPKLVTINGGIACVFYASTAWAENYPATGSNGTSFLTGSVVRAISMIATSAKSGDKWLFARFVNDLAPKPDGIDIGVRWQIELPYSS